MRAVVTVAGCLVLAATGASLTVKPEPPVAFSDEERAAILAHGPWPPTFTPDPSNRVAGDPAADPGLAAAYAGIFGSTPTADSPELVLVNTAKALASFQETITTGRTAFDAFRDALANVDRQAMANYSLAAQRGLKIFVGKGRC